MTSENERRRIIDVDSLQRELSVHQVAAYYGACLPEHFGDGGEQRMSCPCRDCRGHEDGRSVSINTSDPFKRWKCHREGYGCGAQGNLITLAYCLKHGAMPRGGKPSGKEFYAIAQDLERIARGESLPERPGVAAVVSEAVRETAADVHATVKNSVNTPLAESENENARKLVSLDEQLTVDLADHSPAASRYARRRPFLLSETLARECRFGYMPGSSKSTLRGKWVFGVMNQEGQPLAWIGRNVRYEEEYERWATTGRQGQEPVKYRFPNQSLFRRGLELYGQEFVADPRFTESLQRHGIILVEGFTDRVRLHELGVMALAMMSNQLTAEQAEKLAGYARRYAGGRVGLMHDADIPGDEGAKESLWRLHELGVEAYLVWSRKKFRGQFADRQPESLTGDEWHCIAGIANAA
jgi:hypothetical protein